MKVLFCIIFVLVNIAVFVTSVRKAKNNGFYTNTRLLNLLGIYVWGDALMLAPFWAISSILFFFISTEWIVRYLLLFLIIRSFIEIIYWINHQVAQRDYIPPLFSRFTWLKANEAAILYQVMHTCFVVLFLFGFIYSFYL